MTIQVTQITGDVVELAFPPREETLRVGDVLSVLDRHSQRSLVVQILEIRTGTSMFSPRQTSGSPRRNASVQPVSTRRSGKTTASTVSGHPDRYLAIAKIRRVATPDWQAWDGWIPTHHAIVTRTSDREVLQRCLPPPEQPLTLGRTLAGEPFAIDSQALTGVNIVSGADSGEIAGLASVVLRELVDQGRPCIVFDLCSSPCLCADPPSPHDATPSQPSQVVCLRAGDDFKLDLRQCGPGVLLTLLTRFGLPKLPALYVLNQVMPRPVYATPSGEAIQSSPFLGIEELIQLVDDPVARGDQVQVGAILGCLSMIRQEEVVARTPADMTAVQEGYEAIRRGGSMIVNLSTLTQAARGGVVRAVFDRLVRLHGQQGTEALPGSPCLILEEPHLYFTQEELGEMLMHASTLGMISFILTTCVTGIAPTLLRRTENLFLLPHRGMDELRSLANSGLLDYETATSLACRLGSSRGLLVGRATRHFPVVFALETGHESLAPLLETLAHHAPLELSSTREAAPQRSSASPSHSGPRADTTLPLFPDDASAEPPIPHSRSPAQSEQTSSEPSPEVSLARIIARWDRVIKRVGRRRRILETILSTARPVHLDGHTLLLGFPSQSRFQQELMASPEYRSLLEEELTNLFGVPLEVTATLIPLSETPRH